jgi:hypothetical protein
MGSLAALQEKIQTVTKNPLRLWEGSMIRGTCRGTMNRLLKPQRHEDTESIQECVRCLEINERIERFMERAGNHGKWQIENWKLKK